MASFADIQYRTVDGSEKVPNYADVIHGWSPTQTVKVFTSLQRENRNLVGKLFYNALCIFCAN